MLDHPRIFFHQSVSAAQLGVVYVCVYVRLVCAATSVRTLENAMYGAAEVLGDSASNNGRVRN